MITQSGNEETQMNNVRANVTIDMVPGFAQQVWTGWVWSTPSGGENFKAATKEKCEEYALWYFEVKCKSDPECFLRAMEDNDR